MKGKATQGNSTHFLSLRRRLDSMGYADLPLGIDSSPLVQHLLEDLVATTELLKETEEKYSSTKEELTLAETQIEPLQSENVRLTRETTQLHQRLISAKEELVKMENQNTVNSFELQADNRRLKLINQKANEQVKDLEKKLEQSKAKLQEVSDGPSITNVADVGDKDTKKVRRSTRSHRTGSSSINFDIASNNSAMESEIRVLNEKVESQLITIAAKDKEINDLAHKLDENQSLLKIRDDEITRLGSELQRETGKNGYMITLRHRFAQQNVEIEKLRAQVRAINAPTSPRIKRFYRIPPKAIIHISPKQDNMETTTVMIDDKVDVESKIEQITVSSQSSSVKEQKEVEDVIVIDEISNPIATPARIEKSNSQILNSNILQEKTRKLKEKNSALKHEINSLNKIIDSKDSKLAGMVVEIAFLSDTMSQICEEKDQMINYLQSTKQENTQGPIIDQQSQAKINKLNEQKRKFKEMLQIRDQTVFELQNQIQVLSKPKPLMECMNCKIMEEKYNFLQKEMNRIKNEQEDVSSMKSRINQLEKLLQAFEEDHKGLENLYEEINKNRRILTLKENEIENLKQNIEQKTVSIKELSSRLEDSEKRNNSVYETEQKFKSAAERLKAETNAYSIELKERSHDYHSLNEKYIESQKIIRELQNEYVKMKEDTVNHKEEALFHRGKSEEVQKLLTNKIQNIQQEAGSTIEQMKQQLIEKTKEAKVFQKLLSDTRRQMAPLTEVTIPQLKEQIAKMQRERSEIINRINALCQLSQFTEKSLDLSPSTLSFVGALHQLQDQLRPFAKNL